MENKVPGRGLEPLRIAPPDPKSGASANFATLARSGRLTELSIVLEFVLESQRAKDPDSPDLWLPIRKLVTENVPEIHLYTHSMIKALWRAEPHYREGPNYLPRSYGPVGGFAK